MKKLLSIIIMILAVSMTMMLPATKDLIFCCKKITKANEKEVREFNQPLKIEAGVNGLIKNHIVEDLKTPQNLNVKLNGFEKNLKEENLRIANLKQLNFSANENIFERTQECNANVFANAQDNETIKQALNLNAKSSILMDSKTGNILYSDNAEVRLAPASMTKVMTMLLVMEEIEKGNLSLNQEVLVSEYAASQEGSECFLDANKNYTIFELLKSVAVASANDSCVALAECVSGDEKLFVNKMNEKAKELGMVNTQFVNCTGLDESGHFSTAKDLCFAIKALSKYSLISELEKTWTYDMKHFGGRITSLTNTNRLVRTNQDIVVAKTGHTDDAGFCIVTLAKRGDKELILCVMGLDSSSKRFEEITKLLNYGFSNYENKIILTSGEPIGEIKIKHGKQNLIEVFPKNDLSVLEFKDDSSNDYQIVCNYFENEYLAPIMLGDVVGEVQVFKNGKLVAKEQLVVNGSVDKKTLKGIIIQLMEGWFARS